jgi:hypothetical protein
MCVDCGLDGPSYADGIRDALDLMQARIAALSDMMRHAAERERKYRMPGWMEVSGALDTYAQRLDAVLPPRPSTPETTTP